MNANKFKNPTSPLSPNWAPNKVGTTGYTAYPNTIPASVAGLDEEWHSVTIATIENVEQVIKTLTEAINGKHGPLKNKLVFLRIKPGATIRIARLMPGDYEPALVKKDGWDVDQVVIDSLEFLEVKGDRFTDVQMSLPIAYISFKKVAVDQNTNPADGFWFQLSDLEWRMV